VTSHRIGPTGGAAGDLVFPSDKVLLRVGLSDPTATNVKVKVFVEDFEKTGEVPKDVAATGTNGWFDFTLDAQKENSVVRYQIVATKDGKETVVSPRASDPFRWHSYFVNPPLRSQGRQYHLFINMGDWETLWTRAMDGHVKGCNTTEACLPTQCEKSEIYDQRVPATFVHDGKVYDVYARYQGSRYGRKIGPFMPEWPYPKPANPAPFRALSWSIKFPRHARLEGKDVMSVSKARDNICWAMDSFFGTRLAKLAGVPSPGSRMVRFNINGGYYHYMREWIETEDQLVSQLEPKGAAKGELYEAKGFSVDEGPWAISDFRPVTGEHCGYTPLRRYQETYELKTNKWKGHEQLIELMNGLEAARATNDAAAVKKFLQDKFEWDQLLSYLAFQSWAAAWDDTYHNFALYRRPSSGKWILLPWDFDNQFGGASWMPKSTASPYMGMQASKDSAIAKDSILKDAEGAPRWSRLKDAVFRYARPEFNAAMMKFINTVATPQNVDRIVEELPKEFNLMDAMESSGWAGRSSQRCDFAARLEGYKQWAKDRNAAVPGMLTNE
jgi:hypothetical protein